MTTMATETRPIEVGDRVRWTGTRIAEGYTDQHPEFVGMTGTVTSVSTGGDHILTVDLDEGDRDHVIASGWASRRWERVEPDAEPDPLGVGARVRSRMYGTGEVVDWRGHETVPPDRIVTGLNRHSAENGAQRAVRLDGGMGGYFGDGVYLLPVTDLVVVSAAPATAPAPFVPTVGARVTTPDGPGVIHNLDEDNGPDCCSGSHYVSVTLDNGQGWAGALSSIAPENGEAPATPVQDRVNNEGYPVGTRVLYNNRYPGTVLDKGDEFIDSTGIRNPTYDRDSDFVPIRWDHPDQMGSASYARIRFLSIMPDTTGLSEAEQLVRLQRLIHRVASYEAVRREWCDEINGALAPLNLPAHLSTVDRDLGRRLQRRPDQLLILDGEIESARTPTNPEVGSDDEDDDEPEPIHREFSVEISASYDAEAGYGVSGAVFYVNVSSDDWDEDYDVDTDEIYDLVNAQFDERGLVREIDGSELPTVSGYSLDRWEVTDWSER